MAKKKTLDEFKNGLRLMESAKITNEEKEKGTQMMRCKVKGCKNRLGTYFKLLVS